MEVRKVRNGYYIKTINGYEYVAKDFKEAVELMASQFGEPSLDNKATVEGQ